MCRPRKAKAGLVVDKLRVQRLGPAAELVHNTGAETLAYYAFPEEHWHRIRTNNPLERLMREIRRRPVSWARFQTVSPASFLQRQGSGTSPRRVGPVSAISVWTF